MPLTIHDDRIVITPLTADNTGQNTLQPNTRIILTDNQNTGNVNRLLTFRSTYDVDRPWISWEDENDRHVACMGYHTRLNDALGGDVLKQFEIKTIASSTGPNPADLRTRLGVQVDKQRITYGHTYTRYLEVYQGENTFAVGEGASEDFGLILRTCPQDTVAAAASNFIIGNVTATIDASDNATMNIDVKPPYGSGGSMFPGNKGAGISFFRNVNLPSVSNPSINIKKGDGTNTDSITIIAKTGTLTTLGTITGPLQDKAGQVYSVKAYGAVGDGTTNDATAVQAASDAAAAAGGGIVFFPTGVYKVNTTISVILPSVLFVGCGWDQATTTAGSVLKAGAAISHIVSASSAATKFSVTDMSFDGAGNATNCVTTDGLNSQFTRCHARNPASGGVMFNVTSGGASVWFTDCRANGANQTNSVGFSIAATDSIMTSCKGVNCLDATQYQAGSSGAIHQGCHHTPGSSIGRCCINVIGNSSRMQFHNNRIDNHLNGSAIQISPTASVATFTISNNTFYAPVVTNNTYAAIGVDTTNASIRGLVLTGNVVEGAASHLYAAFVTAQKLDGSAASNPTRMASQGTTCTGNIVWATAMFGASSTPTTGAIRGNILSTDGSTYTAVTDA